MPPRLTQYGLYRENPFRVYFDPSHSFEEPRRDDPRKPHPYKTEAHAWEIVRLLKERTFVGKLSYLRQRIKNDARS